MEQRLKRKVLISILGILVLFILYTVKLTLKNTKEQEEPPIHIPVISSLENVWIMEATEDNILCFIDGVEVNLPFSEKFGEVNIEKTREQVADIILSDNFITDINIKTEKANGKVLRVNETSVEIEGLGNLFFTNNMKGYQVYAGLTMSSYSDILIGYNFTDFILENGKICSFLIAKEEAMEYIRVLIKNSNYQGIFHETIFLTADVDYTVSYGANEQKVEHIYSAGEFFELNEENTELYQDRILIKPTVLTGKVNLCSVERSQGQPNYRGSIEILKVEEGYIVINEVLLEEYLYSVVPSEMPASYPAEALKAQAICARTYGYLHMQNAGYRQYGAHVDDSAGYQVYNNILENEETTTSVKNTYGELLFTENGALAETYYYSTSCGYGTNTNIWKSGNAQEYPYIIAKSIHKETEVVTDENEKQGVVSLENAMIETTVMESKPPAVQMMEEESFRNYILANNVMDFESSEGWYRWTYTATKIDNEYMLNVLKKRYEANAKLILTKNEQGEFISQPITELDSIQNIYINKREEGGIADELILETKKHTYKVISEHNIRYVLNDGQTQIIRQDNKQIDSKTLLPSAFFVINLAFEEGLVTGYSLSGGGYGHGVGMSQNGAKEMAKCEYTAEDILHFFYESCTIGNIYSTKK